MKNQANKAGLINEILTRGVEEAIDRRHLEEKLLSGKKLRIKLGIDPTSPNIHIGRAVQLWKLRAFQELGHKIVLIIGDFTGLIGDTSDKESERPMLTEKQVKENLKGYLKQAGKIIDLGKTESHFNSEWLRKLRYLEIGKQADQFGLGEFIARENIAKRMAAGKRVSLREVLYPLMQGYDSVAIKADVELGGTDQRFNLLAGRELQRFYRQEPQDIITLQLLEGLDGRKMSSSWGNVINLTDPPNDMFGKVMSLSDELITKYFIFATRVPMAEILDESGGSKLAATPYESKKRLAREIVTLYHGKEAAKSAQAEFEKVFSEKGKPTEIPTVKIRSAGVLDVLIEAKLVGSKSEARRMVEQGGVRVDDVPIKDIKTKLILKPGSVIQVGKRKFAKVK